MIAVVLIVCALVALDQVTKYIAVTRLLPIESMTVVPGVLDFTFVKNTGAAFGILEGQRWFFVLLTIVIGVGIFYALKKMPKNFHYNLVRFSLILVLSGAVGNAIDRLIRGFVVDFLEVTFISWPVFNVADIYVVIGSVLLAYLLIFVIKDEPGKKEGAKAETRENE